MDCALPGALDPPCGGALKPCRGPRAADSAMPGVGPGCATGPAPPGPAWPSTGSTGLPGVEPLGPPP
eukprot:2018424-Alexandrium_andersonii.AAC.1